MQALTAAISDLSTHCVENWAKVNLFSNRVNLFSTPYHRITVSP
jgi:hypothetical protein